MDARMAVTAPLAKHRAQALRFVIAGGLNTVIYVGLTLLLSGPVGLPIQVAIPMAYATAITTHFLLQRYFVFRSHREFQLSVHEQAGRYVLIAGVQYPVTALATAVLPGWLGVDEQMVYAGVVVVIAAVTFLLLRMRVFHHADG